MSDGERVALYLMGECLCAPINAVVIVDEPEIHIHKAIQSRLWDALESARPDCIFVYFTHDLDFAAERSYARRIWVEAFDGTNWKWHLIDDQADIPTPMTLQILGSRKPILFVEGEPDSLDRIYRSLYPGHTVIARGSCFSVIRSVRSMSQPGFLSGHKAFGLIDRDRRSQVELDSLLAEGVYSCPVAEVENLLCLPAVLSAAANAIHANEAVADAIAFAIQQFRIEIDRHAIAFAYKEVHFRLGQFAESRKWTKTDLEQAFQDHVKTIDVGSLYETEKNRLRQVADTGNYLEVLKVFNRKGLANQLAEKLGYKSEAFQKWFFGTIDTEALKGSVGGVFDELKSVLPTIPTM